MAFIPKRVKYRKSQRRKNRGVAIRGSSLTFGEYGLKTLENGKIRNNHLETARVTIVRKLRGAGKLWIKIFPHKPISKKPAETRMGKGKGDLDHWEALVKRGCILFEISGVPEEFARQIFRLVAFKMPVRTRFVSRAAEK